MVPRPGTTSPEEDTRIMHGPEARMSPTKILSATSDLVDTRPTASVDSEGTSTTGREASGDDEEAYEKMFAVPDAAPSGAALDLDSPRGPDESLSEKTTIQKTKSKKKKTMKRAAAKPKAKKMRAPNSDEERSTPEAARVDSGREMTPDELDRGLCLAELSRLMAKDPILKFLQPAPPRRLVGPIQAPDVSKIETVRHAVHATASLLKAAGYVLKVFDTEKVYNWNLASWKRTFTKLLTLLRELVEVVPAGSTAKVSHVHTSTVGGSTGSSRYHSVSSIDEDSDDSSNDQDARMTGSHIPRKATPIQLGPSASIDAWASRPPPIGMEEAFSRMMTTYAARHAAAAGPVIKGPPNEDDDELMESVESEVRSKPASRAYPVDDPEDFFDLGVETAQRPTVAAAAAAPTTVASMTRVRMSAFSELKEFSGRDSSEEKSRSWFNRVRSAARRDGMSSKEVCSLFVDLMTGAARQWYLQLGRQTRCSWEDLTEQFLVQYCGKGVSMASRYYHANKRVDESPLEYLHRLNLAGIRAGLHFMEGNADQRREHIDHYIRTLGYQDPELSMQLTMLMIPDVPTLEKVLRKRQRGLEQQKKPFFGSGKYRQKSQLPPPAPRAVHSIQAQLPDRDPGNPGQELDREEDLDQDEEEEVRARLFVAAPLNPDREGPVLPPATVHHGSRTSCRHCNSTRHDEVDCWKLLTCEKCGGHHPSDRCMRVCKACGEVHRGGECPMEEFFNLLRQWYSPSKHAGLLPPAAEKMLN